MGNGTNKKKAMRIFRLEMLPKPDDPTQSEMVLVETEKSNKAAFHVDGVDEEGCIFVQRAVNDPTTGLENALGGMFGEDTPGGMGDMGEDGMFDDFEGDEGEGEYMIEEIEGDEDEFSFDEEDEYGDMPMSQDVMAAIMAQVPYP
ncbi:hypothetical protein KIPB_001769 [Kipferlia bialata]|uniref:Uncharacterized protein n=1 Tax=Kipferlia bialata TaxID=797122 RepID=A0A9K3GFD1_9EUKA|nr:hypothetical protein KIPB_001769 [Kipferlia bialata]|eukprot:g1769.t1